MILDAENRVFLVAHPFHCLVIQVDVGDFDRRGQRFRVDGEPVILRGNRYPAVSQVLDWLVPSAVAKLQFDSFPP